MSENQNRIRELEVKLTTAETVLKTTAETTSNIDNRVRELEVKLKTAETARKTATKWAVVPVMLILAWLGYTNLYQIPSAAENWIKEKGVNDLINRIGTLHQESETKSKEINGIVDNANEENKKIKRIIGNYKHKISQIQNIQDIAENASTDVKNLQGTLLQLQKNVDSLKRLRNNLEQNFIAYFDDSIYQEIYRDVDARFNLAEKIIIKENTTSKSIALGDLLIEVGSLKTPSDKNETTVHFIHRFYGKPYVVATTMTTKEHDYGYPIIRDVEETQFTCEALDKLTTGARYLPKNGATFNFIAIGNLKK